MGWENGKGCAIGCTLEGYDHERYPIELGIPVELAHLEEQIFEGLSNGEAKDFPLEFLEAIPLGADLSGVADRWKIKNLERLLEEQTRLDYSGKTQIIAAIRGALDYLGNYIQI